MTSCTRPRTIACFAVLAAWLAPWMAPAVSHAAMAPTTPTFALTWGSSGSAGGQFNAPSATTTDAAGNLYVVDTDNHRIQKFDGQGHYVTGWGGFGSAPSKFNTPSGIAVDALGNVYVVDQGNSRIKVYDGNGVLEHQWGSPGTGQGQFSSAVGIAADPAGDVYVSDGANRIQKFTGDGSFLLEWGTTGLGNGEFNSPAGLATDANGNVFVADRSNDRIQEFNATGTYIAQWGGSGSAVGQFSQPAGIAVDALGHVYVADLGNDRIQKFAAGGSPLTAWGTPGPFIGQFDQPSGIAVDAAGNVFVAEINNHRIQKFSGAGMAPAAPLAPAFALNFGTPGSGNGQLNASYGVAVDDGGYVYVADTFNHRVQKFSGNGAYVLQFGQFGAGPGQFAFLQSVAVDAAGNIYATSSDDRVEKFDATGSFLLQWGAAGSAAGQFDYPWGIAIDAMGFVYVADGNNDRIQKFTDTGVFVSQWGGTGAGGGLFSSPKGVATDAAGNVYVTDNNALLQKFTSTGVFVTQWAIANSPAYSVSNVTVDDRGDVYVVNGGAGSSIQKFRSDGTPITQWGSYGTGDGQFAPATDAAVDHAGNVYVTDYNGTRVVKFVTPPSVLFVSDVGNDQGRQVRLRFRGASVDAPANGGVTGYAVYRKVEALPVSATSMNPSVEPDAQAGLPFAVALAGWDYLGTQPAGGDAEYSMVVPTLADANASSTYYSAYLVRALTSDPLQHSDSAPEYGYSIDNLSPPVPSPFLASFVASDTYLHWGVSGAADFSVYRLYRGANADFVPGPGTLVATQSDTGYVEATVPGSYYKLSAVDRNGNESPFARVDPPATTSVRPAPDVAFALDDIRPNPVVGGAIRVGFALPSSAPARLELMDVAGRLVDRQEVGPLGAGRHVVALGTSRPLAPGLYLVRLRQGARARTVRAMVVN